MLASKVQGALSHFGEEVASVFHHGSPSPSPMPTAEPGERYKLEPIDPPVGDVPVPDNVDIAPGLYEQASVLDVVCAAFIGMQLIALLASGCMRAMHATCAGAVSFLVHMLSIPLIVLAS